MNEKIDSKESLDAYQAKRDQFRIVDVPDTHYLMVDGHGDQNTSPAYAEALRALYPVAYKAEVRQQTRLWARLHRHASRGLWWAEDMDSFTASRNKSRWDWTMKMMVPDWTDRQMFDAPSSRPKPKTARRA